MHKVEENYQNERLVVQTEMNHVKEKQENILEEKRKKEKVLIYKSLRDYKKHIKEIK